MADEPRDGDDLDKAAPSLPTGELGVSGLKHQGGRISEEWLARLRDHRGMAIFREMADNDAVVGAILFAIEMLVRSADWRVEPFSEDPEDLDKAAFLEECIEDMSSPFGDVMSEILSMLTYGHAAMELVYKRRVGPTEKDPAKRSRHTDGRIGWRKIAPRSQDTIDEWDVEPDGGVRGIWQVPPDGSARVYIPIEKLLLFRTTSRKANPEGRSILRNAFVPWYHRKHIQEVEAVGVERDLTGLPVFYLPAQYFGSSAPEEYRAVLRSYQTVVESLRADEQGGLLLPSMFDEKGNRTLTFELMTTNGQRLFDTSEILARYSREISMVVLADFIHLGHEAVGSFALSSDKTALFSTSLGAWLSSIAGVFNRHAIPRLFALNGWDPAECPSLAFADFETPDVEKYAAAIATAATAGWVVPGSNEDENAVRGVLGLPPKVESEEDPALAAPQDSDAAALAVVEALKSGGPLDPELARRILAGMGLAPDRIAALLAGMTSPAPEPPGADGTSLPAAEDGELDEDATP